MSDNKGLSYVDAGLNDVSAWDGATSTVNPGEYHLKCTKVEGGTSNAGKAKMVLTFEVVAPVGDRAEDNEDMVGRTIVQSQSLDLSNDTVRSRIRALVDAMLGGPDGRGGFEPEAFIEAEMVAEVVAQEYSKANPLTQEPEKRTSIKVIRERSLDDFFGDAKEEPEEKKGRASNSRGRGRRSQPRA
jgi:hypothetical protein